ncbi:MAG: hypothetical protein R3C01_02950 [Planctomycetaceae bacterium]
MELVSRAAAERALEIVSQGREWPVYIIFVGIISADCVAIGPREGLLHGDLLTWIRAHIEAKTKQRWEFEDKDVFDGYIECDDDGSRTIRTMGGVSLPKNLTTEIERILSELEQS